MPPAVYVRLAGAGTPGYAGDGGDARNATFGSNPAAEFDGPIALGRRERQRIRRRSLQPRRPDDRARSGIVSAIAGTTQADPAATPTAMPRRLNLPFISSMDWHGNRRFDPTEPRGRLGRPRRPGQARPALSRSRATIALDQVAERSFRVEVGERARAVGSEPNPCWRHS